MNDRTGGQGGNRTINVSDFNRSVSNHTNRDIYNAPVWMNQYVGGELDSFDDLDDIDNDSLKDVDPLYASDQFNLINRNHDRLPPSLHEEGYNTNRLGTNKVQYSKNLKFQQDIKTPIGKLYNLSQAQKAQRPKIYPRDDCNKSRFDPYEAYLFNKGLLDDGTNRRRYITHYVDINSNQRTKKQVLITENACTLSKDPLRFKHGTNEVYVSHPKHNFKEGDNIVLSNICAEHIILRTFDDKGNPAFVIPNGCNIMKIYYRHRLPKHLEGVKIKMEIIGVKPDKGSHLGSVPINVINSLHNVYTQLDLNSKYPDLPDDFFNYSEDHLYLVLPKKMHSTDKDAYVLKEYNFKIVFHSLCSVPLDLLNCSATNSHTVKKITKNGYLIYLPSFMKVNVDNKKGMCSGGGSCIEVSKVKSVCPGYPNPNKYTISLGNVFNDVLSVRMISSEFPNVLQIVQQGCNDKMHWNNIDDGNKLYSITVPPGNYTADSLSQILSELVSKVPRADQNNYNHNNGCIPEHHIQIDMNSTTNRATLKSYKKYILSKPFKTVTPEIFTDPKLDSFDAKTTFTILINHPQHGLADVIDHYIVISNSLDYKGISSEVLNGEHKVSNIVDQDSYEIIIQATNLLSNRSDTGGGVVVSVMLPDMFKLRLDKPDSITSLLGFNSCKNDSFQHLITGDTNFCLTDDRYIIMVARPLSTFTSVGPIKEAFAKIQLGNSTTTNLKTLFNTFVPTSKFYDDTIHELYELEVEFFTENGRLVDFKGLDHSYTLEISTVYDIPEGTGISANTGRNYNVSF